MIVYGDSSQVITALALLEQLVACFPASNLDEYRRGLVLAGQLEQAVEDDGSPHAVTASCRKLTDMVADAFVSEWSQTQTPQPMRIGMPELDFDELRNLLAPDFSVVVREPEGFALYSLYPEAFCESALRWMSESSPLLSETVAIVGIRTIGTALSAVVGAMLRQSGMLVTRTTVRPTGHPYDRKSTIDPQALKGAHWLLIVDEGPGASGSSMVSVAEAAVSMGFPRDHICFMPGHGGAPGAHASDLIRRWWNSVSIFATETSSLRWNGRGVTELLAHSSSELLYSEVERISDLSGGRWRAYAYSDGYDWPAVTAPFERSKYLIRLANGQSLFWKFIGHGIASEGQLATKFGYAARHWLGGKPLSRHDLTEELAHQIGNDLVNSIGVVLEQGEIDATRERLREMLFTNISEAFGEPMADHARHLLKWHIEPGPMPSCKDGRMAPHEWLLQPNGDIVKVPSFGKPWAHTLVGRQPICWDVAAALVEWDFDESTAATFFEAFTNSGIAISESGIQAYTVAYAAFRMGQCVICGEQYASESPERNRLRRAEQFYRERIRRELSSEVIAIQPPTEM